MNLQRTRRFLRENSIFYLAGILVALGIKYYYSQAECDSLLWILTPTARWVELLSGIPFTYVSGAGYVNHSLRMLIAPACSGVQFMIITVATLIFSFVHIVASPEDAVRPEDVPSPKDASPLKGALSTKDTSPSEDIPSSQVIPAAGFVRRVGRGAGWIVACVVFSWLFTVLVNGLRIIVSIYLPMYLDRVGLMRGMLTADRLHTVIGVVVYFTALLMLYRLVDYVVQRKINLTRRSPEKQFFKTWAGKCTPPIFWYFLMTLGLPFLNRAYLKNGTKFKEHATLIICCIVPIFLSYCLLSLLHSRKRRRE